MKPSLLFLAVFGFAIVAGGQTPAQVQRLSITANVVEAGSTTRLRGNVRISFGTTVVVADEVDVPTARVNAKGSPSPIQLRGNATLTFDNSGTQH